MKRTNASTTIGTTLLVTAALSLGYLMLPKVHTARAASPTASSSKTGGSSTTHAARERARVAHGKLPVSFEINQGQFDAEVQFASRGASYRAFVTKSETIFVMTNPRAEADKAANTAKAPGVARAERQPLSTSVVRMSLMGANTSAVVTGLEQLPGKINYFRGNDPAKWLRDVPTFNRVRVASVYPGVDLVYYGKGRDLEYDLVVAPGANTSQIAFNFEGAERVEVDPKTSELIVHTPGGAQLRQSKPLLYQEVNGSRHAVSGGFTVNGSRVGFAIGEYDAARPLVIDPVVVSYSTYLGGEADDQAHDVAVDAEGNAHVVGWTNSTDFPTRNAYDTTKNFEEAFVTKFNADGSGLIWSSYLGGSASGFSLPPCFPFCGEDSAAIESHESGFGGNDGAYAVALDADGNVYLTGFTDSTDFPTQNPMQQHLARGDDFDDDDDGGDGEDSFITKLNADGNQLLFSSYFGGVGTDVGRGIAVDSNNDVYVTGYTNAINFPTTDPIQSEIDRKAERNNNEVRFDGYLAKIGVSPSGQMFRIYSTFIGGDRDDVGLDVAVDAAGNAYVTGWTESTRGPCENGSGVGGPVGALYAADGAGGNPNTQLYTLDPATGAVVETIGPIGYSVTGLAFDPTTGVLYGSVGNQGTSANNLITIDPETGAGTVVGPFNVGAVADIAFDADGNLFGWASSTDDLYTIDKTTGAATLVGESNIGSFGNGLAFDSSGVLYLAGGGANGPLYIIDSETGTACEGPTLSGAPRPDNSISALKAAPDGLYGANISGNESYLVLIDAQTGAITTRGPTVGRLTALAFAPLAGGGPTPVPPAPPSPTPRGRNFPTTAGAFQQDPPNFATRDAFITKVNPAGSAYVYSTFLSGAEEDVSWSIAVASDGSAYVAGYTDSESAAPSESPTPSPAPSPQGFPTTANAYQPENNGGYDAFLSRLNPEGSALIYSTYLGGSQDEGTGADGGECLTCVARYDGAAVAIDFVGNAYITGWTESTYVAPSPSPDDSATPAPLNFPTKDAAQPQPGSSPGAGGESARDAFLAKFNTNAATGEDSLVYSTFLGGPERDEGQGVAVDLATNAYVTGVTGSGECCEGFKARSASSASSQFVINAFATTEGAFQENPIGNEDAFLVQVSGGGFNATPGSGGGGGDGTGFILTGRVTQSDGTTPVAGATITLTRADAITRTTTTDSNGIYFFEDLAPGSYTVTPSGGGFVYTPPSQTVVITNENERADFVASEAPSPSPSPSASPSPSPSPSPVPASQPVNLSTRLNVELDDRLGIGGFIITGTAPKHVIVRGIGPSLTQRGVSDVLPDPVLELRDADGALLASNDNWRDTQEAQIQASGIPPTNDLESAIDATLAPGAYTALLSGIGDDPTGLGLVEVYDLDQAAASKLANISTRAFVGTGESIVIAGFVLGNGNEPDRVVIRGLGPSLTAQGVPDTLQNPTLELRDGDGALLLSNNDWQDNAAQAAEITAAGLAPSDNREAAIAATLPPGLYTALLAGLDQTTGIGIVEVYDRGGAPAASASPTPAPAK